jgi:chromosome segregation ATPase
MRSRAFEETVHETLLREREMRELTAELEKCRTERDEWERSAMDERVEVEESRASLSALRRELEMERAEREREAYELDREKEKSTNLQSVLEDFQSGIYSFVSNRPISLIILNI